MKIWFALAVSLLVIGCGGSAGSPGAEEEGGGTTPSDPVWGGETGTLALPAYVAGTTTARIIVRRGDYVTIPSYTDPETGEVIPSSTVFTEVFKYVKDVTVTSTGQTTTLPLPLGTGYTIEVISGGAASGGEIPILDYAKSNVFDLTAGTTTVAAPGLVSRIAALTPTFTFPAIYAGLDAPYNTYTVTVGNLGYPFSLRTWTMSAGAIAGTQRGVTAQFAAPAAGQTGTITYTAKFYLDTTAKNGETVQWAHTLNPTATIAPWRNVGVLP